MGLDYSIVKLVESDLDSCEGFLETLENLSEVGEIDLDVQKKLLSKILEQNGHVYVAKIGENSIVGSITLLVEQKFIHHGGKVGHMEDVVTRKGYEGCGVGSSLVQRVLDEARKFGCYKVILDCSDSNMAFYERFGFYRTESCMRVDL